MYYNEQYFKVPRGTNFKNISWTRLKNEKMKMKKSHSPEIFFYYLHHPFWVALLIFKKIIPTLAYSILLKFQLFSYSS